MNATNEKAAHRVFKNIRNRIRRLDGGLLLEALLNLLHHPDAASIERRPQFRVWHLLLLIKWTIQYGSWSNRAYLKPATEYRVCQLVNRTQELGEKIGYYTTLQETELFLRCLSYQQFWVQRDESIPIGLCHQLMMFGSLSKDHPHYVMFKQITSLSVDDFIDLSTYLLCEILNSKNRTGKKIPIFVESFSRIEPAYGSKTIRDFLDSISITLSDGRDWLQQHSIYYDNITEEYFEQSPLMRYPLIKVGDTYLVISDVLLKTALSTFVADVLRDHGTQWFMRKFGSMYEELLNASLSSIGLDFITENDLIQHFGQQRGRKFVDFVVSDKGCNIFIEAKGVSLRWDVMVTDIPEKIAKRSETSIEKGIRQAYNLAANLLPGTTVGGIEVGYGDNFLLLVTFKDTYLCNGQFYYNNIDSGVIDEIIANEGKGELIPLSHIFFISVDELEILMGQIAHGPKSLSEWLSTAVDNHEMLIPEPKIRKVITQKNGEIKFTPLIRQTFADLFERVEEKADQ